MTSRPVVLMLVSRGLYPALLVASVLILLRGHNEPGGGFIGGMVAVAATALRAVAGGSASALTAFPGGPVRVAAAGVALAGASGLPALALGRPYLTHLWAPGSLPLSTVLAFDLGVYLVVWGALGGVVTRMIALDEAEGL
ncbi:MAG: MnhB domain-containing protein [Vicinamibacterales bacterium]